MKSGGDHPGQHREAMVRASTLRFLLAATVVFFLVLGAVATARGLLRNAPSGARARAALVADQPGEARRLAQLADELTDGEDQEARAVLDELDLRTARTFETPRARAEAVLSQIPRTEAGRAAAERLFFDDAEAAVSADDGSTIEEIRFATRAWPNVGAVDPRLVALREIVVLQRCVKATKLVCATFFPAVPKRHPAVAERIEAFRARQTTHAARVFRESQALLKTKPDPSVAGAAQRDQILAATEHVTLALPAERDAEIAAFAASHSPAAFHATPR